MSSETCNNNNTSNHNNHNTIKPCYEAWRDMDTVTAGRLDTTSLTREYDNWSNGYNKDLQTMGYRGPFLGAQKASELATRKDCRILDVGCGTGMVGEELSQVGFTNVDGVDISEQSMAVARGTGCYKDLYIRNIEKDGLPGEKDQYDMVTCVGVFIPGHLNQTVFPEFCRVVKTGGLIVIAMREEYLYTGAEFVGGQMDNAIVGLAENKSWNYVSRERVNNFIGDKAGTIFVFQKC